MARNNDNLKVLFARIQPQTFDLLDKIAEQEHKSKALCIEEIIESKRKKYSK